MHALPRKHWLCCWRQHVHSQYGLLRQRRRIGRHLHACILQRSCPSNLQPVHDPQRHGRLLWKRNLLGAQLQLQRLHSVSCRNVRLW